MSTTERDEAILEHLRRFHLTTPEILHRLFFPDAGLNAVRKVTGRLVRERKIRPCPLYEQRKYFVLTPGQAARMGEDRRIGQPYEEQGLVNAYGILLFCIEQGTHPFSKAEFEEKFPELVIRGVGARNYYVDREETAEGRKTRLGFIVVDYGTSPETIRKKVHKVAARAHTRPEFSTLIHKGGFVIAVVAPTDTKAEDIKAALAADGPGGKVLYRIVASPELGEYLLHKGRLRKNERRRPAKSGGAAVASEAEAQEGAER